MKEEMRNPYLKLGTNDLPSSLPSSLSPSFHSFLKVENLTHMTGRCHFYISEHIIKESIKKSISTK